MRAETCGTGKANTAHAPDQAARVASLNLWRDAEERRMHRRAPEASIANSAALRPLRVCASGQSEVGRAESRIPGPKQVRVRDHAF